MGGGSDPALALLPARPAPAASWARKAIYLKQSPVTEYQLIKGPRGGAGRARPVPAARTDGAGRFAAFLHSAPQPPRAALGHLVGTRPCPGQWPADPSGKAVARATVACEAGPSPRPRPFVALLSDIRGHLSAVPGLCLPIGRWAGARASAGGGRGPGAPSSARPRPRVCPPEPVGRWHLTGTALARSRERKGWHARAHTHTPRSVSGEQEQRPWARAGQGRAGAGEKCVNSAPWAHRVPVSSPAPPRPCTPPGLPGPFCSQRTPGPSQRPLTPTPRDPSQATSPRHLRRARPLPALGGLGRKPRPEKEVCGDPQARAVPAP